MILKSRQYQQGAILPSLMLTEITCYIIVTYVSFAFLDKILDRLFTGGYGRPGAGVRDSPLLLLFIFIIMIVRSVAGSKVEKSPLTAF